MDYKFSSPREEALERAHKATNDILDNKNNVISILHACLVIAKRLNKSDDEKWITSELLGYSDSKDPKFPSYRVIDCYYRFANGVRSTNMDETKIGIPITIISAENKRNQDINIITYGNKEAIFNTLYQEKVIFAVTHRCLFFLSDIINELQYGGVIEFLMEGIRNDAERKVVKLDKKISDEINSLCLNLRSTNPADWPMVGHSCRRVLKFLGEHLFPYEEKTYKMKDGREIEINDKTVINRLLAFIDKENNGEKRKFLLAELSYLESYLRQVVEYTQMGEHKGTLEKFHAEMIAIHTYLVISEVLKLVPEEAVAKNN